MKESQKLLVGVLLAVAIVVGISAFVWMDGRIEDEKETRYKRVLQGMDKSISDLRFDSDPSSSLKGARDSYTTLVENEGFENDSPLFILDNEIKGSFQNLIDKKSNAKISQVKSLRKDVIEMGGSLGVSLSLAYRFSPFFIVILTISIAFISTAACRILIDWEKLEDAKKSVEKWEEKIREAQRGKGKKKRKLELEGDKLKEAKEKVWANSVKQAFFYLAPLILVLPLLKFVYGSWVVVRLPFNWFNSGMMQQLIGVSFKYLGWYLLSFFGFAYIWREVLISEEK